MTEHAAEREPRPGTSEAGDLLDRIVSSLDAARADLLALSRLLRWDAAVDSSLLAAGSAAGIAAPEDTASGRGEAVLPPAGIDSTDTAVHPEPRESRQARPDQP